MSQPVKSVPQQQQCWPSKQHSCSRLSIRWTTCVDKLCYTMFKLHVVTVQYQAHAYAAQVVQELRQRKSCQVNSNMSSTMCHGLPCKVLLSPWWRASCQVVGTKQIFLCTRCEACTQALRTTSISDLRSRLLSLPIVGTRSRHYNTSLKVRVPVVTTELPHTLKEDLQDGFKQTKGTSALAHDHEPVVDGAAQALFQRAESDADR